MILRTPPNKLVGIWLFSFFVCVMSLPAQGISWKAGDLKFWKERVEKGPYLVSGDAIDPLLPGEWSRIEKSAENFKKNPSADRKSSYVITTTSAGATAPNYVLNHIMMLDASFYALVTGDEALAKKIKDELVWHSRQSGLQISPTKYQKTDHGNWWNSAWLLRMVMCADFVEDAFTSSELKDFREWVSDWAHSYESSIHTELSVNMFPNRYQRDYENNLGYVLKSASYNTYAYKDSSGVKHNQIASLHRRYNNRKAMIMEFVGLTGVWLQDEVLVDRAKIYFEEWIQFSVFPDGSTGEYERNTEKRSVQQGINYNAINIAAAVSFADALHIQGDDSLFEYSTRNGFFGTECNTNEPAKNLKLTVDTHLNLITGKTKWYYVDGPVEENYRLDATAKLGSSKGTQWLSEIYFAPMGNRYWKSNSIKEAYMRTADGSIPYSNPIGSAGPNGGPWRGHNAVYPSLMFMYSETEDLELTGGEIAGDDIVLNDPVETEDGGAVSDDNPVSPPVLADDVIEESVNQYELVYALNYNWSNYKPLDGHLVVDDIYISVKPNTGILSVEFYNKVGNVYEKVNTENYAPYDYINTNVAVKPTEITSDFSISATVKTTDGKTYILQALVKSSQSTASSDALEETITPADWRVENFGLTSAANAGDYDDFDSDGSINLEEWLANTDPSDPNDNIEKDSAERRYGVTWESLEGRTYQIELSDDNWVTKSVALEVLGTGDPIQWTDPGSGETGLKRSYRVILQ